MTAAEKAFISTQGDLNREERFRSLDRFRVGRARASRRPLYLLALLCGPGILVMLGENDGPSMVSYATTGATYGIGFFVPFILVTFAIAYVVQEMTVRLGTTTGRGHAELIFARFGPLWGYIAMGDLFVGNFLTLVTEFIAVQAGGLYFGIPSYISLAAAVILGAAVLATRRYLTWERALIGLAIGNLFFIPCALYAHPNGAALLHALAHWGPIPGGVNAAFFMLILANIGATVTPWMIFFQQSATVDKGLDNADLTHGRVDTAVGSLIAAIVAIAALVATSTLYHAGRSVGSMVTGADFATALHPFIGQFGSTLFALGIIEAGIVASIAICTSSAYAVGEICGGGRSLNVEFKNGKRFYGVALLSMACAAALVLIPKAPLVAITITVNVVATVLMVPALLFLLLLVNDREIMGRYANGLKTNLVGGTIIIGICAAGALYGVLTVFPNALGQ